MTDVRSVVVDRLVDRLVAACAPREIVLFGSYAKGMADRCSDIDLLVVMDGPVSPTVANAAFDATRAAIAVDVHVHAAADLVAAAADPYGFLGSILRTGVTVYRRQDRCPSGQGSGRRLDTVTASARE